MLPKSKSDSAAAIPGQGSDICVLAMHWVNQDNLFPVFEAYRADSETSRGGKPARTVLLPRDVLNNADKIEDRMCEATHCRLQPDMPEGETQ